MTTHTHVGEFVLDIVIVGQQRQNWLVKKTIKLVFLEGC